jgi:putative ABC transport system substrate-binding protein
MPVVGFINGTSPKGYARPLSSFIDGLGETGYVEGRNVAIEYRWAEGQYDRLPAFVEELIQRKVAVIAATSTPAALAARAAATTIPIVFTTSSDPVQIGLVDSLSRPSGNITGVTQLNVEISPKRMQLAHELVPTATIIGLLVNPKNPQADVEIRDSQAAVASLGLELSVLDASAEAEIEHAITTFSQVRNGVLVVGTDPYFSSQVERLAALMIRNSVPAIYEYQAFWGRAA